MLHKIRRLQDGLTQNGILILNIHDPSGHERWNIDDQMVKKTFWLGFNSRPALSLYHLSVEMSCDLADTPKMYAEEEKFLYA